MLFYQEEKHILIFRVEIKYTLPVPVQHSQNAKTNLLPTKFTFIISFWDIANSLRLTFLT